MEVTIEIAVHARRPLSEATLALVAQLGGAAAGTVGERRLETTLTVEAPGFGEAIERAIASVTERCAGRVLAIEAMTTSEADRRLRERPPVLAGLSEVAAMLGVSRQRASMLSRRDDFPAPSARLAAGPIWRAGDLSTFAARWQRKPGRPRKLQKSTDAVSRL